MMHFYVAVKHSLHSSFLQLKKKKKVYFSLKDPLFSFFLLSFFSWNKLQNSLETKKGNTNVVEVLSPAFFILKAISETNTTAVRTGVSSHSKKQSLYLSLYTNLQLKPKIRVAIKLRKSS